MLVLSRRRREEIVIGNEIVLQVLNIRSGSVKLGVSAPGQIPVLRRELVQITDENITRSTTSPRTALSAPQAKSMALPSNARASETRLRKRPK